MSVAHFAETAALPTTKLRPRSSRNSILGLDLLRVMAALIVTFHHLAFGVWANSHYGGAYSVIGPPFWFGWIGVQIFFVISGFVIPYSARTATLSSFLISRATRLYPAAWICATITALDLWITHTVPQFAPHLTSAWLRSVLLSPFGPWVDGVYWTLAVEMCFYFLIALLLAAGRFRSIGKVMGTLGALSSAAWVLYLLSDVHLVQQRTLVWIATKACHSRIGMYLLLEHGCYFALGTLLWLGFSDRFTPARKLLIAFCGLGGCCEIALSAKESLGHNSLAVILPIVFWFVSMVALALMTRYNSPMHDIFGTRGATIIRRLGLMTYPLYLLHQQNGYIWVHRLHGVLPDIFSLLLVVGCLCVLSYLVNRFAEVPIQRRLRRFLSGGKSSIAPASVPASTLP
jgi:peptidoglycan/LPS O-acetylase OafA/YrhL